MAWEQLSVLMQTSISCLFSLSSKAVLCIVPEVALVPVPKPFC